jgi:ABC-2 type transport system permease protein
VGIILVGAAFISIGLFISSLTENQLAAAIITVAILFGTLILDVINPYISVYAIRFVVDWFCIISRFSYFSAGILDYSAMLYYLSITGIFLMLTVRVYERRRWA